MNLRRTHTSPLRGEPKSSARRNRQPKLLSLALALVLLVPAGAGNALVRTTVDIDGSFSDWVPVFEDGANCVYDPTGDAGNSNIDLSVVASTYDDTYLYHYIRRASATGGGAPTYLAFIDLDGDNRLETGDRVVRYSLGGGNAFSGGALFAYVPANAAAGDPMPGDASRPAGSWNTEITVPAGSISGAGEDGGVQIEARITWAALGVPTDTPLTMQFYSSLGSARDNSDVLALRRYGVTVAPDRTSGASADTTVTYSHTVTNTGNLAATFNLAAISSKGWTTQIRRADNGQAITSVTLAPATSMEILVSLRIPSTTADGVRDTLSVIATHASIASATDTAVDATTVGPVLVVPDRTGSMAPGGTIVYENSVLNNTEETRTITLTATSDKGWPTAVYDATGTFPMPQVTLAPHETLGFTVQVQVPSAATLGTKNVTTIEAKVVGAPNLKGKGYDTTTARPALAVDPDNAAPAGAGTTVVYRHTVTNSWSETRTVDLTAASSLGWTARLYAEDGSTPLTSVTLAPYGGSVNIVVRVTAPQAATSGLLDVTTVTGTFGATTDIAQDRTTVSSLVTFGISGFGTPQDLFDLGDRVYARGMGLTAGTQVRFRWTDPNGVSTTSNLIGADAGGIAQTTYNIANNAAVGTWIVTLLDSGGATITSSSFYVGYRASITSLAAVGGDAVNSTITVSATFENDGFLPLTGTEATYILWWDENGSGSFDDGDGYAATDGSWATFGSGTGYSYRSSNLSVSAPNGQTLTSWDVTNRNLPHDGDYHLSVTWITAGGMLIDTREATFVAIPGGQWVELTLSDDTVDFGTVEPGVLYSHGGIGVQVKSSVGFDLLKSTTGATAELGLTTSLVDLFGMPSGTNEYTDVISIDVPWETAPGAYTATLTYTVVMH
ncbi:MAG: hypothetical protein WBI63_10370 [Coriobacteriia bacterium]